MNKSLALKKKLYLFSFLVLFSFLFLYLLYFLVNGDKSILSYFKIKNQQIQYQAKLSDLKKENEFYLNKIKRLQSNTIDLDYLDEKLREQTGLILENEILILYE